jgi:thiosulfate reductase cytochrome b subunit
MSEMAKIMILIGSILIAAGLLLLGIQKLPFLGKLPGDILIKRENFVFYFPLATGIIISIILSVILCVISRFR